MQSLYSFDHQQFVLKLAAQAHLDHCQSDQLLEFFRVSAMALAQLAKDQVAHTTGDSNEHIGCYRAASAIECAATNYPNQIRNTHTVI